MKLTIQIDLDNAVFEDDRDAEVSRILDHIAREYVVGIGTSNIQDINGSTIGTIGIQE